MPEQSVIDRLNAHTPGFIKMLGGSIVAVDIDQCTCTFEFNVSTDFCHSVDVIQGGFITAMLDAAMSHAIFATNGEEIVNVSSLEIKTSYLAPTLAGKLRAEGWILRSRFGLTGAEQIAADKIRLLIETTFPVGEDN